MRIIPVIPSVHRFKIVFEVEVFRLFSILCLLLPPLPRRLLARPPLCLLLPLLPLLPLCLFSRLACLLNFPSRRPFLEWEADSKEGEEEGIGDNGDDDDDDDDDDDKEEEDDDKEDESDEKE